jgi:arylsulfatase A-like enzyme
MRVPEGIDVPERCAVLFFADGAHAPLFDAMLAGGELPNIDRYLARSGVAVEDAVTTIPSITYAAATSMMTGRCPGHHGITGNKWFDRRTRTLRTYLLAETYLYVNDDFTAPTVYEALDQEFTLNVQCAVQRGVDRRIDVGVEVGVCFFFGWYEWADGWGVRMLEQLESIAREEGRWPALLTVYFPALDECGHKYGSDSAVYRRALRNVDAQIGKVCEAYERNGLLDRTYRVFVTDHGHVPAPREQYLDVRRRLRETLGWRVDEGRRDGGTFESRKRHFDGVDAVLINGGMRRVGLHLPGPTGWSSRPSEGRCRAVLLSGDPPLVMLPAVELGVCRMDEGDRVWVVGRNGEAIVRRRRDDSGWVYRYDALSGDPLGYQGDEAAAAAVRTGWNASRDWLLATRKTRFPDFVAQIVEAFGSPRSPDVLLFAAEGWDFSPLCVGGHGSVLRGDMRVPMLFAGPGLPSGGRIPVARAVDIAPTLVEMVAGPQRVQRLGTIDGASLLSQLRAAEPIGRGDARP